MSTRTIPLTTIFTPGPSCLASTFTVGSGARDSVTQAYGNPAVIRGVDPVCYPNHFYAIDTFVTGATVAPFYSPGVCPSGYSTATTRAPAGATVTTVTCCPSLMWAGDGVGGPTGSLQSYCTGGFYTAATGGPGNTPVVIVSGPVTSTLDIYVSFQLPVVFQYQAKDLLLIASLPSTAAGPTTSAGIFTSQTTTAATLSTQTIPTATAPPVLTPSSASSSSTSESPAALGISPAASIGIGVGVGVGFSIILVLAGMLLWMRRKKSNPGNKASPSDHQSSPPRSSSSREKSPVDWNQGPPLPAKQYTQPAPVYEADGGNSAFYGHGRSELDGQWRGWEADPTQTSAAR